MDQAALIEAIRTRRPLALVLFTFAFSVGLAFEWLLWDPKVNAAPVTLSAGVLEAVLLVTRRPQWLTLIGISLALRAAFIAIAVGVASIVSFLLSTVGVIAVAVLVGLTPWLLARRQEAEVPPFDLVATTVSLTLTGAAAVGLLRLLMIDSATPISEAAITSLSLFLGLIIAGPPIVVLGRHTHAPRPVSIRRVLDMVVCIIIFSAAGVFAFGHFPEPVWEVLGPFTAAWPWIALPLGILMAMRTHTIGAAWVIALVALTGTATYFLNHEPTIDERLNWQISALGVLLVLLACQALIGSVRRANDQRRAQEAVSHIMLGRAERGADETLAIGDEFTRALSVVAEFSNASQATLYWLDNDRRSVGVAYSWPTAGGEAAHHETALRPLRDILGPILLGRIAQLSTSAAHGEAVVDAFQKLGVSEMQAALLQPVAFGGRVVGFAFLGSRFDTPFRRLEVAPLLTMIAEFYVSDLTRERALGSIRNYQRRLRELAARTAQAEERVRRETAVELHDGLIQRLAVARMKLGELRHRAGDTGPVTAITDIVDESLAASRGIIHDLSPSVVYELGLIPGLEKLVDDQRTEGRFRLALREHGEGNALEEPVRVGIYHVVQELVDNSVEHSGGSQVWIDVYWEQAALDAVVVSDNGRSDAWWLRETAADEPSGLGLLSASERLRPIGYDIKFERRLGGGTRAIVFWSSSADG
ncbi:MAG: ATP-binding protein [Pseudomonadota bacterium]